VEAENPSACATADRKVCTAIALSSSEIKGTCNQGGNKSNRPNLTTLFSSRVSPYIQVYVFNI
jgi:hypothetical protein